MPVAVAFDSQAVKGLLYACGAAAIVAPLLALVGNEPRRIIALLGSGATAVGAAVVVHGFEVQGASFAVAGIACVLGAVTARAGGRFAMSAIAAAKRADDLAERGEACYRMLRSALGVLLAAFSVGVCDVGARA